MPNEQIQNTIVWRMALGASLYSIEADHAGRLKTNFRSMSITILNRGLTLMADEYSSGLKCDYDGCLQSGTAIRRLLMTSCLLKRTAAR